MFNLLPKAEKEAIRREYRTRLAIVVLWCSFTTLIVASILLIPSLLLSFEKEKVATQRFETLSRSVGDEHAAEFDTVLLAAKTRLSFLSHAPPKTFLYELMTRVVSLKPPRLSLSNFSLTSTTDGKRNLTVQGIAENRATLLSFEQALERSGAFEKVTVPISNFAKDTNIEFSIQAQVSF